VTSASIPCQADPGNKARKQNQRDWAARTIRRLKRGEWETSRSGGIHDQDSPAFDPQELRDFADRDYVRKNRWERDAEGHLVAFASDDVESLKATIKELRRQITIANEAAHQRNLDLDALHYVWCNGGCEGGVHRWTGRAPLTEDLVVAAERNTERMRTWLRGHRERQARRERIAQGFPEPPYPHKRGLRFSLTLTRSRVAQALRWIAKRVRR
jgi:hypothetical protein